MSQDGAISDERTPLVQPPSTVTDDPTKAIDAENVEGDVQSNRISYLRGTLCIVSLGFLIFIQGTSNLSRSPSISTLWLQTCIANLETQRPTYPS